MAKPSAVIPQWAVTANFGSTNYPAKILSTDPTAAASMAAWIVAVSSATAVSAPSDFGEILHPNAGAGTPWSLTANKEPTGLAAFANTGFEPALPIKSESFNQWLGNIWEYVEWLRLASSAADLDDHVVQTDAAGATALAKILAGGTALADSAAVFTSNSSGDCVTIADTIGAIALIVTGGSAAAAIQAKQTGSGHAVEGILNGASATGSAVKGDAGSNGAIAIEGDGGSSGTGVQGTNGATGGFGVRGVSVNSSPAIQGEGNASSSSSEGVQGVANHDSAFGVRGFSSATGVDAASGVHGDGRGNATGVHGTADDGYGVIAESDTMTPRRAAMRLVGQDTDPSALEPGAVWVLDQGGVDEWLKWSRGTIARYVRDGLHQRMEDDLVAAASNLTGVATTATAVQSNGFTTLTGGDVILTVRAGLSISVAAGTATYLIESADAAGFGGGDNVTPHETEIIDLDKVVNGLTRIEAQLAVTLQITPTGGDVQRFYRLRLTPSGGGANVKFWNPTIRLEGEFV